MNKRLAIEEYGYQDFLLIKARQSDVLAAICAVTLDNETQAEEAPEKTWRPGGIMKALLNGTPLRKAMERGADAEDLARDAEAATAPAPFGLHRGEDALPSELLTIERGPASLTDTQPHEEVEYFDDIRVSGIGLSDWVLVEYREYVSGISVLGHALSEKLKGRDVLYFRRSGDLIGEYRNDFHLYQDGETARRVLCHSTWPEGDIEQEWWENTVDGDITDYEPDELYDQSGEMDLLDNTKLEEILAKLDLSSQKLFSRVLTRDAVLISRREGGEPLAPRD